MTLRRAEKLAYYFALALAIYMPLHVFLSQSVSLVTGGLGVWDGGKDVLMLASIPFLLIILYLQKSFEVRLIKNLVLLIVLYGLLHVAFLLFDKSLDTRAVIVASVFNNRIMGYLLLGIVVARSKDSELYIKNILKATLIICGVVSVLGIAQYFLPKDILTHLGYSIERGVRPNFFIDDKPDFPRVMSTLRDPNSLGAFLVFPITYPIYYLFIKKGKQAYKVLPDKWLKFILIASTLCLIFTFSRSGLISTIVSIFTLLLLTLKNKRELINKYAPLALIIVVLAASLLFVARDTYVVQNLVLHSDTSTNQQDPNELRLSFGAKAIDHIKKYPQGEGPGTAGIVAIGNPKGGVLTENYYLQIAYEVGVIGLFIFVSIYGIIIARLYRNKSQLGTIVFATGVGLAVFSLLNHSWSNEALALQWWLLAGLSLFVFDNGNARRPRVRKNAINIVH
jgi:hypothetical protein